MGSLECLWAIEEIKRLKARYFYCLDHKDWEGWRNEVFAPDATMDVPETKLPPIVGSDQITDFVAKLLEGVLTIHHGHMPIIEVRSATQATGIWAMEDVLFWPRGHSTGWEGRFQGYGHYRETYERGPNGWRIKSLLLTRLHIGPAP